MAPRSCRYVALSYVWGQSHLRHPDRTGGYPSLRNAPKVITDSIEVVMLLGFRYLWVDRYCIDQSDLSGKHDQISRMDSIYASAQLTIIAAAGDDPDIGLPGVNGTLRRPQPACRLGDYKMVSSLVTATVSLSGTAWTSRGWTFQEGLLSRRRLIFTFDQVYFECNGMHCTEVLHLPLEEMLDRATRKARSEVPPGAFTTKSIGDYPWRIMQYVSDFAARQLTYQSDALNAIQGIFRAFEKSPHPLYQLMGVPIMSPYVISGNSVPLVSTISRFPEEGFMIGLLWFHRYSPPKDDFRRTCFPSWTWAGWNGQPERHLEFNHRSELSDLGVEISVENSNGSLLPFPKNHPSLPGYLARLHDPKFIHITARTSTCEIIRKDSFTVPVEAGSRSSYMALLAGNSRAVCLEFAPGDRDKTIFWNGSLVGKSLTAIVFAPDAEDENLDWQVSVLVVEEKQDCAERVGICLRPDVFDLRGVKSEPRMISNFLDVSFSDRRHPYTAEDKEENRQAFKEWLDELPTRTIRIG
ncbi:HET-domain-containing protein [Cadophora sp. DSE1049]|nr:HET-domain-containing protein [Cadophora sp. DSE1049]